jgi:outer membrane protein assembly factor BamB
MPFLGEIPGLGTTPGRPLIEVVSVNPDNGDTPWRAEIPLDGWIPPTGSDSAHVSVAGVSDGVAVIRIEEQNSIKRKGGSYALELATRKVLWHQADFESRAVAGGVVVGRGLGTGRLPATRVLGLDVRTGQQRWTSTRPADDLREVHPAGPTLAVVSGRGAAGEFLDIVDIASGRVVRARPEKAGESSLLITGRCVYDEQSTTICDGNEWVMAIDARTGAERWALSKNGGRLVPQVTGAWHGAVYGWVDNGRPVVLDAQTGTDRETQPGTFPSVVNGSMAIGPWPGGSGGSSVYPVLG